MRTAPRVITFGVAVIGAACTPASPGVVPAAPPTPTRVSAGVGRAFALDSAVRAMSVNQLWPRFDPLAVPLAIYDGRNTVLFRHPAAPEGYHPVPGSSNAWFREGRDPAITANTSASIAGVPTATVMLDAADTSHAEELGALAIHELFHVYQRRVHPRWIADEASLFTYPVDDAAALALRREETFALGRAMASTADEAGCWASVFTALRAMRFARIGAAAADYERGTELNEGLARFVELRARAAAPSLPPEDFPADRIRDRAYTVGASLAAVLDQLQPAWRDSLERAPGDSHLTLDGMLARAAERRHLPTSPGCGARADQRERWAADAARDVDSLAAGRLRRRSAFLSQPGWRLEVDAGTRPLFPQGFDPLNVRRLTPTEILHERFVKLGRDGAMVEVLGRASLTVAREGQHPLFNGVRQLTVTGLPSAPSLRDSAGVVLVTADGVRGTFRGATGHVEANVVRIVLP